MIKRIMGEFFEENYIQFKRYLTHRFNALNEYDVEDIISQTILHLLSKGDEVVSIKNLTFYTYKSLQNGAVDYFRKQTRIDLQGDDSAKFDVGGLTIEEQIFREEIYTDVKNALASIDEKSRYIFIETEFKGRSYESLVEETGEKLGTLLSRKSRAKKQLQKLLEKYKEEL